jgi:cytoskeletal protein CcmA (bactofilin family)
MRTLSALGLALLIATVGAARADESHFNFGGDQYAAGQGVGIAVPVDRDAFAAGYDVSLSAPVTGDAHLAGYSVTAGAAITGNLYAAGQSVGIKGAVGGDVTALANTITLDPAAPVAGNVRLAANTVTLGAPVNGSALIAVQTLRLDSTIAGDFSFFGETITFGPNARITGKLDIHAPEPIDVPASVAPADRVAYTQLSGPDYATEAGKTAEHVVKSIWPAVWATGIWWLLLAVAGLAFITLGAGLVARLDTAARGRIGRQLTLGIFGFAATVGLVPVFAMTLIGIFLVPFVLIFVVVICALAYLSGTYLIGSRIGERLTPIDSAFKRLGVLVASIVVAGLLGMMPILGWLITLALLILGFGAFGLLTLNRWTAADARRLAPPPAVGTVAPQTA